MVTLMFGCCNKAMSVVYCDKEGKIDPNYIAKNYPEGSKLVPIQNSDGQWARSRFRQTGKFPEEIKVVDPNGIIHDICHCPCHTTGIDFMC